MAYAAGTDVPVQKTVNELDVLVTKHGATGFAYGRDEALGSTAVMFRLGDRTIRFRVRAPQPDEYSGRMGNGQYRSAPVRERKADQELRRRWRAKFMLVKALLVAVEDGALTVEEAFLPHMVTGSGQTVAEWLAPQLAAGAADLPSLLPGWTPAALPPGGG